MIQALQSFSLKNLSTSYFSIQRKRFLYLVWKVYPLTIFHQSSGIFFRVKGCRNVSETKLVSQPLRNGIFAAKSIVCIIILSTHEKTYYSWLQETIVPVSTTFQFYKIDEEKSKFTNIRIMCLVMTHPGNHKTKALQVNNNLTNVFHIKKYFKVFKTWGKRCTFIKFLTTKEDDELPTFVSNRYIQKEKYFLAMKSRHASTSNL